MSIGEEAPSEEMRAEAAEARADEADKTSKGLAHDLARAEARVRELQEAVNIYLSAQNHAGYKDGDERCEQARIDLCNVVYDLNEALNAPAEAEAPDYNVPAPPADEERHKDG